MLLERSFLLCLFAEVPPQWPGFPGTWGALQNCPARLGGVLGKPMAPAQEQHRPGRGVVARTSCTVRVFEMPCMGLLAALVRQAWIGNPTCL